ncbi:TonB-dependent receptor [Shewanella algae]|uniref:TonB-dependent receptor n=1 Tax=Shewanella algae TaxID=38313 RepID=UPI00313D8C1B
MKSVIKRYAAQLGGKLLLAATFLGSTSATTLMITMPSNVYAQASQEVTLNIPSGPLSNALAEFGRQSGIQVSYPPEYAEGKQAVGVSGSVTPDEALSRLLQGTGLSYSFANAHTVMITEHVSAAAPVPDDGSLMLETIRVTGSAVSNPADTPYQMAGSGAYISGEQVERFRGTSVGDFISGVPGVLNGDGRNSGALDVNIRGMQGQGRVPVIIDGASNETTHYQGYNGSAARSYIDPDFIGSVSIEKGPSMGADATGATGGVVRMSTIGVDDILLPGESLGVRLKGGFNTNSSSVPDVATEAESVNRPSLLEITGGAGSLAIAGTMEFVDVTAAYVRRKNGNYHSGKNGFDDDLSEYKPRQEVFNTSLDNESWLLKGKLKFDEEHSLELGYTKYSSDYGQIFGSRAWGLFDDTPYQSQLSSIVLDTYTTRYRFRPDDSNLIDLKIDSFLSKVDNRINSTTVDKGGNGYPGSIKTALNWMGMERWGINASNTSRLSTSLGDFKLEYGGAFTRETIGLPDGVDKDWYEDNKSSLGGSPRDGWRKEASGFTALEWKPFDWLTLNGSIRYSHFETLDKGYPSAKKVIDDIKGIDGGPYEPFRRTDGGWSPIGSVTVEPFDGFKIYGKYGSNLRSPSMFESLTGGSFLYPVDENPVAPERARTFEVGLNYLNDEVYLAGDKLRLHAAYFDNHIDNYLTRANIARESTIKPGRIHYVLGRLNLDYAEMRGIEISAEYDVGKYFGSIAWNHYTDVMFCAPEGVLDPKVPVCSASGVNNSFSVQHVPPKNTVTLDLGVRFFDEKLTVGSRLNHVGSRYVSPPDNARGGMGGSYIHPSNWKPYTLVDLYASYEINENAAFDFTIDNLTDRYYVDALNTVPVPAPGRTLRGNLTVKF